MYICFKSHTGTIGKWSPSNGLNIYPFTKIMWSLYHASNIIIKCPIHHQSLGKNVSKNLNLELMWKVVRSIAQITSPSLHNVIPHVSNYLRGSYWVHPSYAIHARALHQTVQIYGKYPCLCCVAKTGYWLYYCTHQRGLREYRYSIYYCWLKSIIFFYVGDKVL